MKAIVQAFTLHLGVKKERNKLSKNYNIKKIKDHSSKKGKLLENNLYLCKYLQGPAEDDCLFTRTFYRNIYIYNTMYL